MRAYRVIEYEAPDDAVGDAWMARTLRDSIDGRYTLPNGCRITACEAAAYSDMASYDGLESARTKTWTARHVLRGTE